MTITKSFWIIISYTIKASSGRSGGAQGEEWHFHNGIMEINMLNALARFVDHPMHYGIEITEHSQERWTAVDTASHRAPEVRFEVLMQDEPPPVTHRNTTVRDARESYKAIAAKQAKPQLPLILKF